MAVMKTGRSNDHIVGANLVAVLFHLCPKFCMFSSAAQIEINQRYFGQNAFHKSLTFRFDLRRGSTMNCSDAVVDVMKIGVEGASAIRNLEI